MQDTICYIDKERQFKTWYASLTKGGNSRYEEEFEDTKGVIRIRISKNNRKHNGQKKKYKRINNDLQSTHLQLKID